LVQSLKALSRQEGATLFMTLLAAFQTLLHRYTGQSIVVVGSPIAGRTHLETEGLIGLFINTLVLRTDLAGNPTFRELLHRVREVSTQAYAHQDLPFEKLVEALNPERDLSRNPLFQVLFNLENIPKHATQAQSLGIGAFEFDRGIAPLDLSLEMVEGADGLSCIAEYNTDLFDAATISRLLSHFRTLLEGIIAHPEQSIATLPLLTAAERQQLLGEWNATAADREDVCIHHLFEAQVEQTPDAVAMVFEGQQMTYRELNHRADQLAYYLHKLGVGPEVVVGICVERSLEMLVGLLGILKAGGAYVPLDPAYPKERLAFMLEDMQAPVLVTQQRLAVSLSDYTTRLVCLDADWEAIAREGDLKPDSGVSAENLAYVIYTSGSTGQPKGVAVSHRSVVNFLTAVCQRPGLTHQDILLTVAPVAFDMAVFDLWLPLTVGARIVMVSHEVAADGGRLVRELVATNTTVMHATPATWRLLLEAGWQHSSRLAILCGGEALSRELATQLLARGSCLWNLYGPTEATVWSTVHEVQPQEGSISIGRPLANMQTYVLDAHGQPVPIGVPGELYIGGVGLARGYLNRPELTAERFIPNPFSSEPGARLYKTGDLVRYWPDGGLEFLGRLDHQVKLRGFRIELGEIEAVLDQHPGLRQVVVVAREDLPGQQQLVAYVIPHQGLAPTISDLRSFLQAKLPDYMVPAAFVLLETLPLTSNGKIDRRALPPPAPTRPELAAPFVAPRTPIEAMLAGIWAEVLRLERVGIHDDFFELGGHSLLATQVMSRLQRALRVELPLGVLFDQPTVAGLAEAVVEAMAEASTGAQRTTVEIRYDALRRGLEAVS
jgi:amino acid adenylation domain-containing protein